MRRSLTYLFIAALALVSCRQEKTPEPDYGQITFSAEDVTTTKAMMNDAALKTNGNKLKVYDELQDFTGTVSWMDANNPYYINDEIVFAGQPIWNYVSGRAYPWTSNGTHKFFSWLSYDSTLDLTASAFCGASFNESTQILSIAQTDMNTNTPQYDFMYSDIMGVEAAGHVAGTPVNLPLMHLFTALNLTLLNTSGTKVLLKSVTLTGMKNKRSATIDYSGSVAAVSTSDIASTDIVLYESVSPDGDEFIHQDAILPLTADFILMWPQTYVELNGAQLDVVYHKVDENDVVSDELTSNIILDRQTLFRTNSLGMDAGTKYTFMLQFKKSTIDIYVRALPWEYEEYDWDYLDHSITARSGMFKDGVLAFYRYNPLTEEYDIQPTADEWSAKTMRFQTRNEVMKGRFYIEAPSSGRWQIDAFPLSAAQYFIIQPNTADIDVYTDNGMAEFTISVNPDLSPSTTQNLYFNVSIYLNGDWHDANSEFNRKNIKLVLDAN
ncbi:MAG: hypothetical protein J6X39_02225 [Bacteroidales bacterium]|nr:hypothetical protein [Bacteroidales bacterium]